MKQKILNQYIELIDELIDNYKYIFSEEQLVLLEDTKKKLKKNKTIDNLITILDLILKAIMAGTNFF